MYTEIDGQVIYVLADLTSYVDILIALCNISLISSISSPIKDAWRLSLIC